MPETVISQPEAAEDRPVLPERLNPFLHVDGGRIYDPLRDASLRRDDAGFDLLKEVSSGDRRLEDLSPETREEWLAEGWLLPADEDPSRRFFLKYVSLEAHTVCNQSCYFCPVSVSTREAHFMPTEQFEDIVGQLSAFRSTIEGVALINYNEPTLDKRFLDQVRCLKEHGLPPAVLSNGSGLTPARMDAIVEMGGLSYLSINLSTLDRERYRAERGVDQLDKVLANLDYGKGLSLADEMEIVVLGTGDDVHRSDVEAIRERFAGSRFRVTRHVVMDRAGLMQIGLKPKQPHAELCGCENLGSRPLQHLHITPHGKVVLCCEDYEERYLVGDLAESSVDEVLRGDELALYRRWIYGIEEAPADFMCRRCIFARTR